MTAWLDTLLFRSGPGVAGAKIGATEIRVRMGSFRLDIPRSSVRAVWRSHANVHGTTGVHGGRGRWLVNGSPDGLVELAIDPPCYLAPGIDTLFRRAKVERLILSLADPDGFMAAAEGDRLTPDAVAGPAGRHRRLDMVGVIEGAAGLDGDPPPPGPGHLVRLPEIGLGTSRHPGGVQQSAQQRAARTRSASDQVRLGRSVASAGHPLTGVMAPSHR
jgi:hypothetical protein